MDKPRRKRGRPPGRPDPDAYDARLSLRVWQAELDALDATAARRGLTMARYLRSIVPELDGRHRPKVTP